MSEFDDILKEAVDYVIRHGFDGTLEFSSLINRLRNAAEATATPERVVKEKMGKYLEGVFDKAVSNRGIRKAFSTLPVVTIDKIKPELRAELDRRILANAQLIKINREQAIDKTLQRFSGWTTSIPKDAHAINKKEVIADIKKPLEQLRYENNRRNIDQGHKLIESVNAVIGIQTNAIAVRWQSRWRRPGYDFREDHKELDGKVFAIRGNWAIEKKLMNKGAGYSDSIVQPAQLPFCSCSWEYISTLSQLPDDMITKKGRDALNAIGQ